LAHYPDYWQDFSVRDASEIAGFRSFPPFPPAGTPVAKFRASPGGRGGERRKKNIMSGFARIIATVGMILVVAAPTLVYAGHAPVAVEGNRA